MSDEERALAERLLRAHWIALDLDPDEMATLDALGEGEREMWLQRAASITRNPRIERAHAD